MMERLTVKWTDKVYDTLDPVDILDNEYSKANYNKLLTKLGEYEDFEEIFREKMTDTACEFLKDKEEFRATVAMIWVTTGCYITGTQVMAGNFNSHVIALLIVGIIPVFLGTFIGTKLLKKISQEVFMKITYVLLLLSGIMAIV